MLSSVFAVHPLTMKGPNFRRSSTPGISTSPSVTIDIPGHYAAKTYQPGHLIAGTATMTPQKNTPFESLEIVFLGIATSRIETSQFPQRSTHVLLRQPMPLDADSIPSSKILEAGTSYVFPFTFVIPAQLTLSACSHVTHGNDISAHHMALPPSVGTWVDRDDLSPHTRTIEYSIKARALRTESSSTKMVKIFESSRIINILPVTPKRTPLSLSADDTLYRLSVSKTLGRGFLAAKKGRLTIRATEPPAVYIGADGLASGRQAGLGLNVEFAAASAKVAPPGIANVSGKLVATTYHAATGMTKLPDLRGRSPWDTQFTTAYKTVVGLFNAPMDTGMMTWNKDQVPVVRRDSGYSSGDSSGPEYDTRSDNSSAAGCPPATYTARVCIPFNLPRSTNIFIPSFYSCLIARVYTLKLTISLVSDAQLTLKVPLQIVAEAATGVQRFGVGADGLPSFEAVMEEAGVEQVLRPRVWGTLRVGTERAVEQQSVLPGYEGRRQSRVVTRVL